jgi:hypothetical protein
MDALRGLFPTLNFGRVSFFLGIKRPFKWGSQEATTLPSGVSGIHIYIREGSFEPCTQEFFVLCAHELVHALQIQESFGSGRGLGHVNSFSLKYTSCYTKEFSANEDEGNKYEDEAYRYGRLLDNALNTVNAADRLPCDCGSIPFGKANPTFIGVAEIEKIDPGVIKRKVSSQGACRGRIFGWREITGTPEGDNLLGWVATGAIIGFAICGPGCAIIGAVIGGAIGVIDHFTGIPTLIILTAGAFILTIVDGITWLASSLIDWLAPGDRPLKVIFSEDDGVTFADPVTVGVTGEPPALAFGNIVWGQPVNELFIGWVSSDNKLNLLTATTSRHKKWEWASDDCGPALTWADSRLYVVWQRNKNRVVSRTSTNGEDFMARVRIGGKVPDDATPGVTYGISPHNTALTFVAWIRKKNNKIGIKSSADLGGFWGGESTLEARSGNHGSAAIVFGNGKLYLAWASKNRQNLHIATLVIDGAGAVSMASDLNLAVRCKEDTGPALAFGNNRLFVAWVGRGEQKLNVRSFDVSATGDLTQRSNVRLDQRAKKNAGPALAYGMNILALGWVKKNR